MEQPRVGFIGVGMMGHGMANNLVAKGFPTTVLGNRNRAPIEDLAAKAPKRDAVRRTSRPSPTWCSCASPARPKSSSSYTARMAC